MTKTLDIVGLGLHSGHITPETYGVLEAAEVIYFLASEELTERLADLADKLVSWAPHYEPDKSYDDIYKAMVATVLDRSHQRAAVAVEGNPMVFTDGVIPPLIRGARLRGWKVTVWPALSAVDTVLTDLELPVGDTGLQILNAGSVSAGTQPFHSDLGMLLLQPSLANNPRAFELPPISNPRVYKGLQRRLLEKYPADHPLWVVRSRQSPDGFSKIFISTVGGFPHSASHIDHFSSIYLPPIGA